MSEEFNLIDVDPFALIAEARQLRGQPILKLAKNTTLKIEIHEVIPRQLNPLDMDEKDREWVNKEVLRYKEKLDQDLDYLPVITLRVVTLEDGMDADNAPITKGTELLFTRPARNEFWDTFEKQSFHSNGKKKAPPYEVRIMRLSDSMGKYICIPT